ncbi:MAG: sigma-70 family RNA polymerase sigma factor [Solirubrobacteraceae bacterium]
MLDAMAQLLAEARRHPLLTPAEEVELAKRIERGDLAAKERLISSNLRLVVSVARHYQVSTHMPLPDLVQEGMIGLIRAAEKFDWRRGFRFSTYATLWIRQAIQRGLDTNARMIRLPVAVAQQERKLAAAHRHLVTRLGREPTAQELGEAAGLKASQVTFIDAAPRVVASLDRPVDEDDDMPLGALLPAEGAEVGEELMLSSERESVHRAVAQLAEPERSVIRLRFGLDGASRPQTYIAIGRHFGIAAGRVRAIEGRALKRLALEHERAQRRAA